MKFFDPQKGFGQVYLEDSTAAVVSFSDRAITSYIRHKGLAVFVPKAGDIIGGDVVPSAHGLKLVKVTFFRAVTQKEGDGGIRVPKMPNRTSGAIKRYHRERGFGFIERDDGEKDIFFHHSILRDSGIDEDAVAEGQTVDVYFREGKKGIEATNISLR